jgi:hypothetical protein
MIVEGYDDLYSIASLMGAHIEWPTDKKKAPVYINLGNGAEEILKEGTLSTFLKSSVIKCFGVLLDADAVPVNRYNGVRARCIPFFPLMPLTLPPSGLIVDNLEEKKRLGVWIMPNNVSEGSLETFLRYLVPNPQEPVWTHAVESVETAKTIGCACKESHTAKANLYTWLSWQDPPGQSPGQCLTKKILEPQSASATPFVAWFRGLYTL